MSLNEKLASLTDRLGDILPHLQTEEATKNALVMPMLSALGYNVFDPQEVVPEFTADLGTKKGEKVDYALLRDGDIVALVECKAANADLSRHHHNQLYRYFGTTSARVGVLTNGIVYHFFTDLDAPNCMDAKPFLEFDLRDPKDDVLLELRKLSKDEFDVDQMLSVAGELRSLREVKKVFREQLDSPNDEFARFFFSQAHPDSRFTSSVRDQFRPLVKKALQQLVTEKVQDRLRSALRKEDEPAADTNEENARAEDVACSKTDPLIETTIEELEGYQIVRAIVREVIPASRIAHRDTQSYFGVLLDDNNRKPICRLHFNRTQKYLGLIEADKSEKRVPIESLDDIFSYAEALRAAAIRYDGADGSPG